MILSLDAWVLGVIIGCGVLCLCAILAIILLVKKKNKKPKHIKVDEEFINNLIHLLGEKDNINDVTVDNGRLKFNVVDLDKVDLNGIKAIATSGVFVTGNIIKTLFKLDSQVIKQALEKNL